MIVGSTAFFLVFAQIQELPKSAKLQPGEVVRVYERTMSRRGTFENILTLTPTKAFSKNGDTRRWMTLSLVQQGQLKAILNKEPVGLRAQKRPNPMWPSAYDGSDLWMTYRIGRTIKRWGNNEFEMPTANCPLSKFLDEVKTQLNSTRGS